MQVDKIIPDPEALLAMHPSELAGVALEFMQKDNARSYHAGNFTNHEHVREYDQKYKNEALLALMEAWCFLVNEGILVPEPGGHNNWHVLSRLGQSLKTNADFSSFLHSKLFPKESLHPIIVSKVYSSFLSGDYETAIFNAFKQIEVAVSESCGEEYKQYYGVDLMRKAFHPKTGPLTMDSEPEAEKEAIMHLFSGAIGRFKNPSSHRHVIITSPQETIEMLQFASHLMKIVDDRSGK